MFSDTKETRTHVAGYSWSQDVAVCVEENTLVELQKLTDRITASIAFGTALTAVCYSKRDNIRCFAAHFMFVRQEFDESAKISLLLFHFVHWTLYESTDLYILAGNEFAAALLKKGKRGLATSSRTLHDVNSVDIVDGLV